MTSILIGFGESLATPEVVWSLKSAGYSVTIFFRRGSKCAARSLQGIRAIDVTPPEQSVKRFLGELIDACDVSSVLKGVLPLDDAAFLLLQDQALPVPFVAVVGLAAQTVMDKRQQFELAGESGFQVPGYRWLDASGISPILGEGWDANLPVIAKPALIGYVMEDRFLRPSGRFFRCANEAIAFLEEDDGLIMPWIIQNVVSGAGEGVFGVVAQGDVRSISGHRRVRMMNPAGSGSSACVSVDHQDTIKAATQAFCQRSNWTGLFMLELLCDQDGVFWFMELNGRTWGSMSLARRRGLEYPAWHVQHFLEGSTPPDQKPIGEILCRHLGRELIHLLFVLRGNRGQAPNWPNRLTTFIRLLRPKQKSYWYNTDRSQRFYAIRDAYYTIRNQFRA